jgi:hypothetical protein
MHIFVTTDLLIVSPSSTHSLTGSLTTSLTPSLTVSERVSCRCRLLPLTCIDTAAAYHKHAVQLGRLQLVPQLAAMCPDADKRAALVVAHKR